VVKFYILISLLLGILGCSSGGSEATAEPNLSSAVSGYATTNTPQTMTITSPESITLSSSVAETGLNFQLNPAASGNSQGVIKTSLSDYNDAIAMNLASIEIYKIFADELRVNNKIPVSTETSSNCVEPNSISLTFTQAMLNSIINIENNYNIPSDGNKVSDEFSSKVNTTVTPPVYFNWFTKSTTASDPYTNVLMIGTDNKACNTIGSEPSLLLLKFTDVTDEANMKATAHLYVSDSESGIPFTYFAALGFDAARKSMTVKLDIKISDLRNLVTYTLRECNSSEQKSASNCSIFKFNTRFTLDGTNYTDMFAAGKADDDGGVGEAKFSSSGTDDAFYYREVWKNTGALTYVGYRDKVTDNWSTLAGSDSTNYDETSYTTSSHTASVATYTCSGCTSVTLQTVNGIDLLPEGYYVAVVQGQIPSDNNNQSIYGYFFREVIDDGGTAEDIIDAEYWGPEPNTGESFVYDIWSFSGSTYTQRNARLTLTGN
jgi:hypothetical protein